MLDYSLTVNSTDITKYIKYDSYNTKMTPRYSQSIVTLDGVEHISLIRNVASISFEFNPLPASVTQTVASALLSQPCSVTYFNLQTQATTTANMKLDDQSAEYLVLCKAGGLKWNQTAPVTLTEL